MTQNNEREKLDVRYFNEKLRLVLEGLPNYTRSELARELQRLSNTASPISQSEQQEAAAWRYKFTKNGDWKYLSVYPNGCEDSCPVFVDALYTSPPKQIPNGWKLISDELPISGIRVLIFTDGVDFNGEQYFDVQSDSLNEFFYESRHDMPEVCIHATHWMLLPAPTNTEVGK